MLSTERLSRCHFSHRLKCELLQIWVQNELVMILLNSMRLSVMFLAQNGKKARVKCAEASTLRMKFSIVLLKLDTGAPEENSNILKHIFHRTAAERNVKSNNHIDF